MLPELGPSSSTAEIVAYLRAIGTQDNREGLARYGIKADRAFGVPHGVQRKLSRQIKRNHERACELFETGWREAQLLAAFTADPKRFTADDARRWAADFDSWDTVDGVSDLFVDTACWRELIEEFAADEREFVRRTAFAMLCWATIHRKKEPDATFVGYLPLIETHATDGRNFVKKGVNWALRTIGKRSNATYGPTLELAERLAGSADKTARWIGKDAVRELTNPRTIERLEAKAVRKG